MMKTTTTRPAAVAPSLPGGGDGVSRGLGAVVDEACRAVVRSEEAPPDGSGAVAPADCASLAETLPSSPVGEGAAARADRGGPGGRREERAPDGRAVGAPSCATAPPVAGLTGMSTCDWPGHLAATVFLQGCPWNCTYCHNRDLIDPRAPGVLEWSDVLAFLGRRRGLLDGLVFSGGEPTRTAALPEAISDVRALGLAVGLHTSGAFPSRLAQVLGDLRWVGLDIKALPEDYQAVVGRPGAGERAWRSLGLVLESGVDYEVRTTIHPGSAATDRLGEIVARLLAAGVRTFALQQAREIGTREGFRADEPGWDDRFRALAAEVDTLGFDRFEARPAR